MRLPAPPPTATWLLNLHVVIGLVVVAIITSSCSPYHNYLMKTRGRDALNYRDLEACVALLMNAAEGVVMRQTIVSSLKLWPTVGLVIAGILLVSCAGKREPVESVELTAAISGQWSGEVEARINNQVSNLLPVSYALTAVDGRISGSGSTPWVDYDRRPSVSGSYVNNQVFLSTSSGLEYELLLQRDDRGVLYLTGRVKGPQTGRVELWKVGG